MSEVEVGRRERKKEETRQRIFQAARDLFKRKGFEATTVDDITERADVAKGTFFNYYPRKEAVLFELSLRHIGEVEAYGERLAGSPMTAVERMLGAMRHGVQLYLRDRDLSRVMLLQLFKGATALGPETLEINQRAQSMIRGFVQKAQAAGELRRDMDAERATYVLRSIFFLTVLVWVSAPAPPYDLGEELPARIRLALEGLASRSGGAS